MGCEGLQWLQALVWVWGGVEDAVRGSRWGK